MSVQSEINRISGNVTAALAAIAEKGVSVPDGSKSDALASLIAAIEAGGGDGGGGQMATGTFTLSEDKALSLEITLEHNAGFVPKIFVIITSNSYVKYMVRQAAMIPAFWFASYEDNPNQYASFTAGYGSASYNSVCGEHRTLNTVPTETTVPLRSGASSAILPAGVTYNWIAAG